MKTEARFVLAVLLMLGVLVGTSILFPPPKPKPKPHQAADTTAVAADTAAVAASAAPDTGAPVIPSQGKAAPSIPLPAAGKPTAEASKPAPTVSVRGPLYRYEFSERGARMVSAVLTKFRSFHRPGNVQLIAAGGQGDFGQRLVVGKDTVDLRGVRFAVVPDTGLTLREGSGPETLRFIYQHPTRPFRFEIDYTFRPNAYSVVVKGKVTGLDHALLLTNLGDGLAYNEADSAGEEHSMAYVGNQLQTGIHAQSLKKPQLGVHEGPYKWVAFRSKFFVAALIGGTSEEATSPTSYLGGMVVTKGLPDRPNVAVTQAVGTDGTFAYRLFLGPQEYARLASLGEDMDQVNPYGYKWVQPVMRPIVAVIMTVLTFLHKQLRLGYGWVLVVFGILMRVVLWPLNQKAMKAQLRNMAVQPLLQEIQAKYKDQPERLQKEMMKLYKEHGFNPLAGCLPMLLPWPVLIALFFVFENTIALRGVSFFWMPDLSAPDPLYILPVFLGVSMFLMQWVTMKSVPQTNSQMKIMMWVMPVFMVLIFFKLPSGLNLYYAVSNLATIPQQVWIAKERQKVRAQGPPGAVPAK